MAYSWAVYATMTGLLVAVVGLLGTARFQLLGRVDRLSDRLDTRFERIDQRFETMELRRREDKVEVLERLDVLAQGITRLESS